jgi:hypothetical protein
MRFACLLALLVAIPNVARAQEINPGDTVYAVSNVHNAMWTFNRYDPQPTAVSFGFPFNAMSIAYDPLTNHIFVRAGGASAVEGTEFLSCVDATSLENLGYYLEDGGCGFETPSIDGVGNNEAGAGNGAITIDPVMRVLYSDGGPAESDNCSSENPNHDSDGQVFAYSLVPSNYGQLIAVMHDSDGAHWMTDGNHLTWDPTERRLWSAPSEYTDNIRPRFIDVGTVHARSDVRVESFGDVTVTGLPTISPASSIGVDPDNRRIFLIPWNPPTVYHPGDSPTTIAEHPEGWYVRVYDMDTYAELEVLDYRAPPTALDSNSHCGYNIDFKLFYDRVGGFLYETNFSDTRGMFYDLDAGTVAEAPVGNMLDVYGFESGLPAGAYEWDHDGDGILDTVEVGANDIVFDPSGGDPARLNDADPRSWTSPYLADTDGAGVDDGVEDANKNGRVDAGETSPTDPTDEPGQDYDGDGRNNEVDNCRSIENADQADADGNGIGDACDGPDPDHDGVPDEFDNCDCVANPDQTVVCEPGDNDGDTIPDADDNCFCDPNTDQADSDTDGTGDVCQRDTDGDTVPDPRDNCPDVANTEQEDSCGEDGTLGDACSPDVDADTIYDACDNCPEVANTDQTDLDNDGVGAACSPTPDTCACRAPGLPQGSSTLATLMGLLVVGLLVSRRGRRAPPSNR